MPAHSGLKGHPNPAQGSALGPIPPHPNRPARATYLPRVKFRISNPFLCLPFSKSTELQHEVDLDTMLVTKHSEKKGGR